MRSMLPGQVDLLFADPPFNRGIQYDNLDDSLSREEYTLWMAKWLAEAVYALKPEGSLFVAISDEWVAEYKVMMSSMGLYLRNWIVWHYSFGVACTSKFSRSHTHILYFTKAKNKFTFNPDSVRVQSARQQQGDPRANPKGKVPDDTWILSPGPDFFTPEGDVWGDKRVAGTHAERVRSAKGETQHPCQMPLSLMERVILAASNEGEVVCDPFAGTATTLVAAKTLGRKYVGWEQSPVYHAIGQSRIDATKEREKV